MVLVVAIIGVSAILYAKYTTIVSPLTKPESVAFNAFNPNLQELATNSHSKVMLTHTGIDTGNVFSLQDSSFRAPVAGNYIFTAHVHTGTGENIATLLLRISNRPVTELCVSQLDGKNYTSMRGTSLVKLNAGDIVHLVIYSLRKQAISAMEFSGVSLATEPEKVAFNAFNPNLQELAAGSTSKVVLTHTNIDTGNVFSVQDSSFKAPVAGNYLFTAYVHTGTVGNTTTLLMRISDRDDTDLSFSNFGGKNYMPLGGTSLVKLNAGDTAQLLIYTLRKQNIKAMEFSGALV